MIEMAKVHMVSWDIATTVISSKELRNNTRAEFESELADFIIEYVGKNINNIYFMQVKSKTEDLVRSTAKLSLNSTELDQEDHEMEELSTKPKDTDPAMVMDWEHINYCNKMACVVFAVFELNHFVCFFHRILA